MEYYCHKEEWIGVIHSKNKFLVRWINLEPLMQSEVSQKEKNKYCALMHIYGA